MVNILLKDTSLEQAFINSQNTLKSRPPHLKETRQSIFHKIYKNVDAMEASSFDGFRTNLQTDRWKVHQEILSIDCISKSAAENA